MSVKKLLVHEDGFEWIPRSGHLWGKYATIKDYLGLESEASARNWVCRRNQKVRKAKYGNGTIVCKTDIDRESGLSADTAA